MQILATAPPWYLHWLEVTSMNREDGLAHVEAYKARRREAEAQEAAREAAWEVERRPCREARERTSMGIEDSQSARRGKAEKAAELVALARRKAAEREARRARRRAAPAGAVLPVGSRRRTSH